LALVPVPRPLLCRFARAKPGRASRGIVANLSVFSTGTLGFKVSDAEKNSRTS
jgi:hypothetical protein